MKVEIHRGFPLVSPLWGFPIISCHHLFLLSPRWRHWIMVWSASILGGKLDTLFLYSYVIVSDISRRMGQNKWQGNVRDGSS